MSSSFLSCRTPICPPDLLARAQAAGTPRVAIAGANAPLPMQAAKEATEAKVMTPVFVGEAAEIQAEADRLDWDISAYPLHATTGEPEAAIVAADLCGTGEADVLMKGRLHTHTFIRAALRHEAGLRTERRFVHVFYISPPDGGRPLLITDAAVNIKPDIETRQSAIHAVVDLLHALGVARPKVAILSATEDVQPAIQSSVEARELALWAAANIADAEVSGPLALGLILSTAVVAIKGLTADPVAGHADAIVVPDIVSGNALAKSLVYVGGGCAAGIVIGARVPILLTSRADPPAARLASVALAAILQNR